MWRRVHASQSAGFWLTACQLSDACADLHELTTDAHVSPGGLHEASACPQQRPVTVDFGAVITGCVGVFCYLAVSV